MVKSLIAYHGTGVDMGFELRVVRNNPLTGENNLDEALRTFLKQIGYIPESHEDEIPYRMMRDCFLSFPGKPWTIDELLDQLDSSKSTLYRYLNKLKGLDLLEEVVIPLDDVEEGPAKKTRKGYRIRFGSLSLAWSIIESHTSVAMENYRKSVDHIDEMVKERIQEKTDSARKHPKLAVDGIVLDDKGKRILLIRRGREPFQGEWALPGGFLEYDESGEEGVIREVLEETNLQTEMIGEFKAVTTPGRDPRGHIVSIVYHLKIVGGEIQGGDDAAEAKWHDLKKLPKLAFDHDVIIRDFIKWNR